MASRLTSAPAPLAPTDAATDHRKQRRGRRRWDIVAIAVLIAVAHVPILRGLALALIADDPMPSADQVLVLRADYCFDRAAEMYHRGTISRILVMDRPANRLVRMGVVPSKKEQCLRELRRRDIGAEAVSPLPGSDEIPWQVARALRAWLAEHPGARVLVLCERFESGDLRFVGSRVMDASQAERVAFRGLPDHRFDETNWWWSRAGVRAFAGAAFNLAYDRVRGEDAHPTAEIDFSQFERRYQVRSN